MKEKILVELTVPNLDQTFDIFLPLNKSIGNIISLLNKSLVDLSNGIFVSSDKNFLYNKTTGERYDINMPLYKTNIKNGTRLILYWGLIWEEKL